MGFWEASTRNGSGTGRVWPPIETCRSAITSSNADCTFAGARLISSTRTILANTGPHSMSNSSRDGRQMRVPTMSAGTRSGVNWRRLKVPPMTLATRHRQGLGEAGNAFDQAVAPREQAHEGPLHHAVLPDDHPLHLDEGVLEQGRGGGDVRLERLVVGHGAPLSWGLSSDGALPC